MVVVNFLIQLFSTLKRLKNIVNMINFNYKVESFSTLIKNIEEYLE